MKILVTGFDAFGKVRVNPSEQIVRRLGERARQDRKYDLVAKVLPTEYAAATQEIRRLIRAARPDAILCLGVASRRKMISLERVALNLDDDPQPDNAGVVRRGRKIARAGPAAFWSTLPLDALKKTLEKRGVPVQLSNHAGTFLCNHVFYVARHEVARSRRKIPCGFLHVPGMQGRGGKSKRGRSLRAMVQAVECCLKVLRKTTAKKVEGNGG